MNTALARSNGVGGVLGYGGAMPQTILPPEDENQDLRSSGVALPAWMWDRLDDLTKERKYKSRNKVIQRLLLWAFQELEREEKLATARDEGAAEAEKPRSPRPKK